MEDASLSAEPVRRSRRRAPKPEVLAEIARCADSANYEEVQWAAGHKHASPEILTKIFEDHTTGRKSGRWWLAGYAAENPNMPLPVLEYCLFKSQATPYVKSVRTYAARNPSLTSEMIRRAWKIYDGEVHYALLEHPNCPFELLRESALRDRPTPYGNLLANRNLPRDLQLLIARCRDADYRAVLARHRNLHPDVLSVLSRDRAGKVLRALLLKGYRNPELLTTARTCGIGMVDAALIKKGLATPEILRNARCSEKAVVLTALAEVTDDPEILTEMVYKQSSTLRRAVLENPVCPDEAKVTVALLRSNRM